MNFEHSEKVKSLQERVALFMDKHVYPNEQTFKDQLESQKDRFSTPKIVEDLKKLAKAEGLWNLFLPHEYKPYSPGLTNLEYAPVAEEMGRVHFASEIFNCSAPDTGNMEILHLFATPGQRRKYLDPLLAGRIRSCVGITEPDVASSDPTNLQTTILRDGDSYIVNGRKWFTTGALHPNARFCIVMGLSDPRPDADPHARHSMIITPLDAPGNRPPFRSMTKA